MTLFLVPPFHCETRPSLDDRLMTSLHTIEACRAQRFPRLEISWQLPSFWCTQAEASVAVLFNRGAI